MHIKSTYPDIVLNAFKSVQAWKTLSLVLLGSLIIESAALGWLSGQRTVNLIPQGLAEAKAPVALSLGEPFSPDYLTSVARGDLFALLNWTPDNIDTQYGQFLSRLTPGLHDAQREVLLAESKQHHDDDLTQSFYNTRTTVKGATVTLSGILVRSSGGREIFRGPAAYILDYVNAGNSFLWVDGVSQPAAVPVVKPGRQ